MTSYTISRWRPRQLHTTSRFVVVDVTVFGRSNSTWKPNFVKIGPPAATVWSLINFQNGSRGCAILLSVSYLMMSLSSEGQHLSENQISSTYLYPWLRYNYFRFGKTTVLKFYFRFRFWPYHHTRHVTLHRLPNFVHIGPSSAEIWCYIDSQDGGRCGAVLLPVSDRVTSLFFGCQFLSANQIS